MARGGPSLIGVAIVSGMTLWLAVRRLRTARRRVSQEECKAALLAAMSRGRERHPVTVVDGGGSSGSRTAGEVWNEMKGALQMRLTGRAPKTSTGGRGFQVESLSVVSEDGTPQGTVPLLVYRKLQPPSAKHDSPELLPVVIVIHPTGSCKEDIANHLEDLADLGFIAVGMDCRYHGARGSREAYDAALVDAWRGSGEHPFLLDNVWDVTHVVDYLVGRLDVDAARIGLTGISLGGMITWLTAAVEPRIAAAAALIGVHGFRWALENRQFQARVSSIQAVFDAAAADLGKAEVDAEVVERVWHRLLPGILDKYDAIHSLPCIAPRPLLVVNGEDDPRCPVDSLMLAVEESRRHYSSHRGVFEVYVQKGTGHTKTPEMVAATYRFFEKHLLNSPPPERL
eukprot:jgi/Tetstr1/438484/TSEL_027039.t1